MPQLQLNKLLSDSRCSSLSKVARALFAATLKLDLTKLAAVLTVFGMIQMSIAYLRHYTSQIYWFLIRTFTSSISIPGDDYLNREIIHWLSENVLERQGTRILTARTKSHYGWDKYNYDGQELREENERPIRFLPTFGTTWFIHQRNVFMVRRLGGGNARNVPYEYAAAPKGAENLLIMCLGRSVVPIKDFLKTCREYSKQKSASYTSVSIMDGYYENTVLKPKRPMETVHFDETVKSELVADIEEYLKPETRKFYTERGIPYRRGYLFHGQPGTGKSSLSLALAGRFQLGLFVIHLPSIRGDSVLQDAFMDLPPKCFVLLEDIDAVGVQKRSGMNATKNKKKTEDPGEDEDLKAQTARTTKEDDPKCTLAGLLNVLDGVASGEGRIVLMTSNRAHMLDKALVRPGRIDKKVLLSNISKKSAELMFLRMYKPNPATTTIVPDEKSESQNVELQKLALEFSDHVPDMIFTPAILQGYLLNYKNCPHAAVEGISAWVTEEQAIIEETKLSSQKQTSSSTSLTDVESPAGSIKDVGEPEEKV